ncbi:deoxyribose-phosphate aldolase [Clostridium sp. chh4-2]|uniref:deoxyribose-phosphate aldolase n=1 Tax=Clostridium sp. chh4-2 TaxID=2067550 RepID=UPI001A9A6D5A|nr:deoxyribose-phosphate aldolase [Clostridium sp. chh4-2]
MKEYRKEVLNVKDIAYMMDPSVLKLDTTLEDVEEMVEACKKYDFGSCFCWPCYYPQLAEMLKGTNTAFGTSLAFPSGQESTETKVYLAHEFMKLNPVENDMVINVGWLKSGRYDLVLNDIKAVREATKGTSLKVIIEAMVLTDEEIVKACELCIEGGADYVKTGTGFSQTPTTLHHVELIHKTVGDRAKLKVAGGVRDLDTLLKMYKRGACRFGIGMKSAVKIIEEAIAIGHDIDISTVE